MPEVALRRSNLAFLVFAAIFALAAIVSLLNGIRDQSGRDKAEKEATAARAEAQELRGQLGRFQGQSSCRSNLAQDESQAGWTLLSLATQLADARADGDQARVSTISASIPDAVMQLQAAVDRRAHQDQECPP